MLKYSLLHNQINNISLKLDTNIDYINQVNTDQTTDFINRDVIDLEIKKYKLNKNVNFNFIFFGNNTYQTKFTNAGFSEDEITLSNKNYRFSYVLIQIFDTKDTVNQNLLHSSYIPIYLFPDKFNSNFILQPNNKYYEFNNIYLSNNISIENNTTLYTNFKFYNAKTGNVSIMFNQSNTSNKEDIFYFPLKINTQDLTYEFIDNVINAKEYIDNTFVENLNRLNKIENKLPIYPAGTLFDVNGNYLEQN